MGNYGCQKLLLGDEIDAVCLSQSVQKISEKKKWQKYKKKGLQEVDFVAGD